MTIFLDKQVVKSTSMIHNLAFWIENLESCERFPSLNSQSLSPAKTRCCGDGAQALKEAEGFLEEDPLTKDEPIATSTWR